MSSTMTTTAPAPSRSWTGKVKGISLLVLAGSLLALARALPLQQGVEALRAWIDGLGLWGPVAFGLVYVLATVLFVPGLILTLAAGAIFGLLGGFVTVSLASTTGAACAFLIARYLARERVAGMASRNAKFRAIDEAIAEGGWRIVALLRLSPAVPFNLQNYLFGLTPVAFGAYTLTSWLAMMPGTFLYVYIGHLTGVAVGGERERTLGEWALLAVGLLATVAVTVYVTRLAKSKLDERTEVAAAEEEPAPERPEGEAEPARPWGALGLALVAALAAGAATFACFNPATVRGWFGGPPTATLEEAYEPRPEGPTFDHSDFDRLLAAHVDAEGWVDYGALASDEAALDAYLARVAEAPFDALGRDEKLALLINAYNAATLKLILDHQPVDSIRDIPGRERWEAERWTVGGRTWSLDQIEHQEIRPKFAEPRIHFVLVCAAVGCPPLRPEAYRAADLEEQLEEQTRYVHDNPTWFRYDAAAQRAELTPLYNWYGGDFEQAAGSVLAFVARYSPELAADLEEGATPTVRFLDYDWALNSVENRQPR